MTDIALPDCDWHQQAAESDQHYQWFTWYLELGPERTPAKVARRHGLKVQQVDLVAVGNLWQQRCATWERDSAQVANEIVRSEDDLHTVEYKVGMALVRLGVTGLEAKNPALLDVKGLREAIREGLELMRKGVGAADMVITHQTKDDLTRQFAQFLGEEIE